MARDRRQEAGGRRRGQETGGRRQTGNGHTAGEEDRNELTPQKSTGLRDGMPRSQAGQGDTKEGSKRSWPMGKLD